MIRVRALVACAVAFPLWAHAAELTELATSFEPDDPFGMYVELSFERNQTRAKIVRETVVTNAEGEPEYGEVSELQYDFWDTRTNLDIRFGLYNDLEFRYRLPFVFQHNEKWVYDAESVGENGERSSIPGNCIDSKGELLDPNCATTGAGAEPLFGIPGGTYRYGFGNMTFGLAYAFFNQKKDDTKATWVVALDYEAPTAKLLDPSVQTRPGARGNIGDRNHKYKLSTSFSRRMGNVDPYFQVWYQLPYRGPGWYSNCRKPVESMGFDENCNQDPWTRSETGIRVPHQAGVQFGSEFLVYEVPERKEQLTLDLRLLGNWVGKGRYYNELSGLTYKLMDSSDYLKVGGNLTVLYDFTDYFQLRGGVTYQYITDHALTEAELGQDTNGNGEVDLPSTEINPNFDFRTDVPGRRFRATENSFLGFQASAKFTF